MSDVCVFDNLVMSIVGLFSVDYHIDLITGDIYRERRGSKSHVDFIKLKPTIYKLGNKPMLRLIKNNKPKLYNQGKLVSILREHFLLDNSIDVDRSYYLDERVPVFKDGDITNVFIDNLLLRDRYYRTYYKLLNEDKLQQYVYNRVCIIDDSYTIDEARNDGLIPVKMLSSGSDELFMGRFENNRYSIDTTGVVFDSKRCTYLVGNISKCGYVGYSFRLVKNGIYTTTNTIRLLAIAFLGMKHDSKLVAGFKNVDVPRTSVDLDNVTYGTRRDLTSNYHKQHPEHYETYLKNSRKGYNGNGVSVKVNGATFNTIREAARAIANLEKDKYNIVRAENSITSLICHRLKGKIKKPIYNRYDIIKGD